MRLVFLKAILRTVALAGAAVLLTAGVSSAADVYLQAQSVTKSLPSLVDPVPMWVFVCDPAKPALANPNCASSPSGSPLITVAAGDTLNIYLANTLPTPVSILIAGQAGGGNPTFSGGRVQSFTHETPAGTVSPGVQYTWSNLRPGTYLYQSGTNPSIEVPMGLYGALVVNGPGHTPLAPVAYPGIGYHSGVLLLFSEIDPRQNQRVADAAAASLPMTTACEKLADWLMSSTTSNYPCTVDYTPTYFLINGEPYDRAMPPAALQAGDPGDTVLLRLLNAGLQSRVPTIVGLNMGLVAEDGNLYPGLVREQASALLPAGKTLDALFTLPVVDATYPVFDRMLGLSNLNQPDGGMLAYLQAGTGSGPGLNAPTEAVNDAYPVIEDMPLVVVPTGVLANDVGLAGATVTLVSGTVNGTLGLSADGSFTYAPFANFSGSDGFTYRATLAGNSYPAQVTLNVSFENDAPVATADAYVSTIGGGVAVDVARGVLGNDADPEGDTLTAEIVGPAPPGLTLLADGSFTYSGGSTTFSYKAKDGGTESAPVMVTLTVYPPANITLNVQNPAGASVTDYRWVVQEDATYHFNPAAPPPPKDTLSTNFHKSYMPVVAQGSGAAAFAQFARDPTKHYFVSVLPDDAGTGSGHTIGGAPIPPGATSVTVVVNNQPIPTAQISVLVFEDLAPTNGQWDVQERGLGSFQITLEDAAGRYGQAGGTMSQDAYGNPLKNSLPCAPPATAGVILSCDNGTVLVKDLPPGKYGVFVVAPGGTGLWSQTTTLEGTKVLDTWVQAGEPSRFVEFGFPVFHVYAGFVNPEHTKVPDSVPIANRNNTVTGRITGAHTSHPPDQLGADSGSYLMYSHTRAWVGLNSAGGFGQSFATVQAAPDGSFTITGIPAGTYGLVIWDQYLDQIISSQIVTLPGGGNLGNIPVPAWFGRQEHNVFLDSNGDGVRDPGEPGLPDQNINLRFRDGTVFQSYPTDRSGFVPFDQISPFFSWQVAEVDFLRFKPTGVTVTVDGGGDVSGGPYPGLLNPQVGSPRTDTAPFPVLLEGFQTVPGNTSIFEWGKKPYAPGENGGIAGIVFYSSTRGENDPRLTVGDPWEPGIPGVKVRLYREVAKSGGGSALAFVQEVQTDSWDAALPTDCPGEILPNAFVTDTLAGDATRCFDGSRNFEQVRPAVFDGGYFFGGISPGKYVVEVVPPPGYELVKEEDKNVDFGDAFATAPAALLLPGGAMAVVMPDMAMVAGVQAAEPGLFQPPCVGPTHTVPVELSLFPGVDTYAPFAGADRPLCNRKEVVLADQSQGAADFHLFTSTPIAGQFAGLVTDDTAIEPYLASPNYGEKFGPPFVPIAVRDYKGREIYRGYTDAFGHFDGLVPSTYNANIPVPSGYSPAMHAICLNDPGPLPGGGLDPLRQTRYSTACYNFMFMPGTTTYADTPVLPGAGFAAGFNPVDCACIDGTPVVRRVDGTASGPLVAPGGTLTIYSEGTINVPNPAYEGPGGAVPAAIPRDYGFGGTQGTGGVTLNGVALTGIVWGNGQITATLPVGVGPGSYQLVVTRGNGKSSINAVTVTVGTETPIRVTPGPGAIQAAVDAAAPGSLILVGPGLYQEVVVMWKPVRLQGVGTATILNASKDTQKLEAWRAKVQGLIAAGLVDLLPGQPTSADPVGPGLFGTELGPGIMVLAKNDVSNSTGRSFLSGLNPSRIDGFTITGADGGGGIFVNGYGHNLQIANNHVTGNSGYWSGGIRVGHQYLPLVGNGPFQFNRNLNIHHNMVTLNGAQGGGMSGGGGLALSTGTDNYVVSRNFICGNFTLGSGAGISHLGLSTPGRIDFNQILFNQSFNQGGIANGGGVFVGGEPPVLFLGGPTAPGLTRGAGNVTVDANLIQGNHASSGHGGGIRTQGVNGRDVQLSPNQVNNWYQARITNNVIVNNVAGWSGGGISLQDTANSSIILNTIANNDSTATVGGLFNLVTGVTTRQPAGISSERHSVFLDAVLPVAALRFSNPTLTHNIVWHNRAFIYSRNGVTPGLRPILDQVSVGNCPGGADYFDLGVIDPGFNLNPQYSILTTLTGANNISADPRFLSEYCNGSRSLNVPAGGTTMQTAAELVEGGNFIDVRYGPLTPLWPAGSAPWSYLIATDSPAVDPVSMQPVGVNVNHDFDNQARPQGLRVDYGADEGGAVFVRGTVTFSSGAFGNVPPNSNILTITATVSVAPVKFMSSTNPAAPFGKTADTCAGTTVPVGGMCTFTVTYTPTSGAVVFGSLGVTHNGTGSQPQIVALSGGSPGTVVFSSGAFGSVQVGTTAMRTITATVSVSPVTFTSSTNPAAPFAKTADTCTGTTVGIGGMCTFTVTYFPTGVAASADSISVTDNATGSPQPVGLSGTGIGGLYFSTTGNQNPPGVAGGADDADIYNWNGSAFSRSIDVTAIAAPLPGGANVDGFVRVDATHFYMSFTGSVALPGLSTVQDEDVVYYNAGVWSMFFDGSVRGVTANLDAISIAGGTLYFSLGNTSLPPGIGGQGDDADIYRWNGGSSYTRMIDASVLNWSIINVDGLVWVDATHVYLSYSENTTVPGLGAVQDEDIIYYSGGIPSVYFDGTARDLISAALDIDAFSFGTQPPPLVVMASEWSSPLASSGDTSASTLALAVTGDPLQLSSATVMGGADNGFRAVSDEGNGACRDQAVSAGGTCAAVISFNATGSTTWPGSGGLAVNRADPAVRSRRFSPGDQ